MSCECFKPPPLASVMLFLSFMGANRWVSGLAVQALPGGPCACCHQWPPFHLHKGWSNRASKSALKLTLNCLLLFPTICSVLYGLVHGRRWMPGIKKAISKLGSAGHSSGEVSPRIFHPNAAFPLSSLRSSNLPFPLSKTRTEEAGTRQPRFSKEQKKNGCECQTKEGPGIFHPPIK